MTQEEEEAVRFDEAVKWSKKMSAFRNVLVDAVGRFLSDISYFDMLRNVMDENEIRAEARRKSFEDARLQEKLNIARRMREKGLSDEEIIKLVELTPEELEEV
ncbi:MAG: hypothetical protein IJQ58_05045 [Synergistaceae bacterium]|nr:hypothetical protein [Synergistaceae bacterium]